MGRGRRLLGAAAVLATAALLAPPGGASLASVPPPTPVGARGSPSPFPTVLHTPADPTSPPAVSAPSWILEDLDTGQVLGERAADTPRPVASLTKIMTALVVREREPSNRVLTVDSYAASRPGASLGLKAGERLTVGNLLTGLLLASGDDAAAALAEGTAGSVARFVELMNRRARALRMGRTRFASPDGLDDAGTSTARDLARLTRVAMRDPTIEALVRARRASVRSRTEPLRVVQNWDVLLWLYRGAIGVKTGFTTPAGHCVVAAAQRRGERLVAVVLGAPRDAFSDGAALLNHGFAAFGRVTAVTEGARLGFLTVAGRRVLVTAGASLSPLAPLAFLAHVRLELREASRLRLPLVAGQRVGTIIATAGGRRLGSVPALAATIMAGRAPPRVPRPAREASPVAGSLHVLEAVARALFDGFL